MTIDTVRVSRLTVRERFAALLHQSRTDLGMSEADVGRATDVGRKAGRWEHDDGHPMPAWALVLVPESLYTRLSAGIADMRAAVARAVDASPESLAAHLIGAIAATLAVVSEALADGRITSLEVPELRRRLLLLRDHIDITLRGLEHVAGGGLQ